MDRVLRDDEHSLDARWRGLLAVGLVAVFPLTLFVVAFLTLALWCVIMLRRAGVLERLRSSTFAGFAVRGVLLVLAVAGLVAIIRDVREIV